MRALQYAWRGDSVLARQWADTAQVHFARHLRDTPADFQRHAFHGLALAYLGRRAEALAAGRRAVALRPASEDAVTGTHVEHLLARIHLLNGDDAALDVLERLLARPYFLSPGYLRLDPTFAPLRGNPRFERLASGR